MNGEPLALPLDAQYMQLALQQALQAADLGEVPVGAVLVAADGTTVLGQGHNRCITDHDPSAHAEMVALRKAAQAAGNYRLDGGTLYVTLEPCVMCSGAMLHARLKRVVYAVADPKTGAAGSVLDVFAQPFNHQTVVQQLEDAGLVAQCAGVLQDFFQTRRAQGRAAWPLRDDALRTPDACFDAVSGVLPADRYLNDLPSLQGLRLHYLDLPPRQGSMPAAVLLCLHDISQWSQAFAHAAHAASAAGWRVIVPDMIGFGRSDKPKKEAWHTQARHARVLKELLGRLGVTEVAILGQGWGARMAPLVWQDVSAMHLPSDAAIWLQADAEATHNPVHPFWRMPFPDKGHCAAVRALRMQNTSARGQGA